jgi:hypothetical protein
VQKTKKKKHNLESTIEVLTRKNHDMVFASKKRAIFEAWRHSVNQEIGSLFSIQNVMTKSLLARGFELIREQSREEGKKGRQYQIINKVFLKYQKATVGNIFNRWKQFGITSIHTNDEEIAEAL